MSDERARRLAGVDPALYRKAGPGDRVMTREGFPGVVIEVQDGPYPQTETYIVALDAGMGGGEYGANEITPLNQASAAGQGVTAADDYPELGSILVERPDHPRVVTASLAKRVPSMPDWAFAQQAGQYPASGPDGLSYFRGDLGGGDYVDCLLYRVGGELVGILNHYPKDFPPYEKKGNVNVLVHPDHRRQGVGATLLREAVERWGVDLDAQDYTPEGEALHRSLGAYLTVDEVRRVGQEAAAAAGVTAEELLARTYAEQEAVFAKPQTTEEYEALVRAAFDQARQKWAATPLDWALIHQMYWCDRCGYQGDLTPTETPTGTLVDVCPSCGDVTPYEAITPEGWPVAARLRVVAEVAPEVEESTPPDFTPTEDEGWTDGVRDGSSSSPFAPRRADDPDYLAAYHVGFQTGKMSLGEGGSAGATCGCCGGAGEHECGHECYVCDASGQDAEAKGRVCDGHHGQPDLARGPEYGGSVANGMQHVAGVLDWIADKADQRVPADQRWRPGHESSFDWCRFRRDSRCYYPKQMNAQATAQMGYAVWVPEDRGYCPRISWPMQQGCPVGEPGPHAPGGFTDATVPWEAGGQRGGSPTPGRYQASLRDLTATTDPDFRFHVTATWADVRAKAKRIRSEGRVRILSASGGRDVVAQVQGETNVYQTRIVQVPGKYAVAQWECGCAWAAYSWGRTGRWRKYEGRMCSHALAVLYEAQSRGAFGEEITEDPRQPRWMDPTIPVKQDGDWDRDKGRYSVRTADLDGYDDLDVSPAQQWAEDALSSGQTPTDVLGMLVALGAEDAPSILSLALGGATFRARVRGLVQTVQVAADGLVRLLTGEAVPPSEVLYPTYDPGLGLSLSDHGGRRAKRTHPDEPFEPDTEEGFAARVKDMTILPGTRDRAPGDHGDDEEDKPPLYLHSTGMETTATFGVPVAATVDDVVRFLLNGAQARSAYVTNVLRDVAAQVGGEMDSLDFRVKGEARTREKIAQELAENPGISAAEAGVRFSDALRFTMLLPSQTYSDSADVCLRELARRGFKPRDSRSIKNYWLDDDPYDGINAVLLTPDGFPFELQFHTSASLDAKMAVHPIYEKFRAPGTPPEERRGLWDRMCEAAHAIHPARPLLVGVPTRQYLAAGEQSRYFVITHPNFDHPTGLFRMVETAGAVGFDRWDGATWVPDAELVRHLAFGSNDVEEVSEERAREAMAGPVTGLRHASLGDESCFLAGAASASDMGPCTHEDEGGGHCGATGKWYYGGAFRCERHRADFPPHEASAESVAADALAAATAEGTSPAMVASELLSAAHGVGAEDFDAYGWYAPTDAGQQIARERTGSETPDVAWSESYRAAPARPGVTAHITDADTMPFGYDDATEFAEDALATLPPGRETTIPGDLPGGIEARRAMFARQEATRRVTPGGSRPATNQEIARFAKQALKAFTPAERKQIIDEGEGELAENFGDLDIAGTHYEALEAALAAQETEGP